MHNCLFSLVRNLDTSNLSSVQLAVRSGGKRRVDATVRTDTASARRSMRRASWGYDRRRPATTMTDDDRRPSPTTDVSSGSVQLAELLGVLSLATDLGMGQPMEHMLRQCLIALGLADRMGLDESDRDVVYYTSLLAWVGCNVDSYEQAKWFGDDIALKAGKYDHGLRSVRGAIATVRRLGAGHPLIRRFRIGVEFAVSGHRD